MFSMYCYCCVSVEDQVLKSAYKPLQKKDDTVFKRAKRLLMNSTKFFFF